MQGHLDQRFHEGAFPVTMNPGSGEPFGIIDLGALRLFVATLGEALELRDAAQRLMDQFAILGHTHPYAPGDGTAHCVTCGMLADWADHAEPPAVVAVEVVTEPNPPRYEPGPAICGAQHEAAGVTCNSQDSHDGPEHVAWDAWGDEVRRWLSPQAERIGLAAGTPALRIGGNLVPLGGDL